MEGDAQKPHPTPEEKPPDAPAAEPELGTYARFQNIIRELPKYRASTLVTYVTRRFTRDSCPSVASALSYTSLLAMVPMMAIGLAMFAAFPAFSGVRDQMISAVLENTAPSLAIRVGWVVKMASWVSKPPRLTKKTWRLAPSSCETEMSRATMRS